MSDLYNNPNDDNKKDNSYNYWNDQSSREGDNFNQSHASNDYYYNPNQNKINPENRKEKEPSKTKKGIGFILKGIAFGLIASITFLSVNQLVYNIGANGNKGNGILRSNNNKEYVIKQTQITDGILEDTDVTKVVEDTMPSIVTITGTFSETYNFFGQQIDEEKSGGGSGIIIGKNDTELLIATNNHVVEGANTILVTFIDGQEATAIIKGTDAVADLAVISVDLTSLSKETIDKIQIANINEDNDIKVGEKAIAIGNALGYGQSVTVGYISAKDREINISNKKMVLLQTDAAINPGNSGGALLNMKGEVIGINTVKFAANEVEGMGYAIPVSRAMPIISELMSREIIAEEDQGYLGITIKDFTEDIAEMFNWPAGVYVYEIAENSGAKDAGILKGDIITGINDIDITSSTQLIEKVTSYRIGTKVNVKLMRNQDGRYVEKEVEVTLSKKPSR